MLSGKEPAKNAQEDEIQKQLDKYSTQGRFDFVVFHPAYEYEQFVGGIVPTSTNGHMDYQTKPGAFLRLCRKAEQDDSHPCVLIIDEINRGNLPKLLGELVYALEYRGSPVTLPFKCEGNDKLVIPNNLYVIATMNSADRSIGHIDVAIRRRFALFPMSPRSAVVRDFWGKTGDERYGAELAELMDKLNKELNSGHDVSADAEVGVGHSYFLPKPGSSRKEAKEQVRRKWSYQVQPLLREYAQLLILDPNRLEKYIYNQLDEVIAQS